jgi:hypothetical protein
MFEAPTSSSGRPAWQKFLFLIAVASIVFFVPYKFSVPPTISLSYIAGYNNHAAIMLFFLGIVAFAVFTRGQLARMDTADTPLSATTLFVSLLVVLLLCIARIVSVLHGAVAQELFYNLNRQQMLAYGHTPYTQFEYLYGPLLLYPGFLLARLFHVAQSTGFFISWTLQWLLGTALLWAVIRGFDFPIRFRPFLYVWFLGSQCAAILLLGVNYTPFRMDSAAFLVFFTYRTWKKTTSPWKMAAFGIFAFVIALGTSMDQALGVGAGIAGFLFLLALTTRRKSLWPAFLLFLAGCGIFFALANHVRMLLSPQSFAAGGLNFPLLPSPINCILLFVYVVAITLLYRRLRNGQIDTVITPLVLAGIAMLPSALGRCDLGHLSAATPAYLTGMAAIVAMPTIRKSWFALCIFFLYLLPPALALRGTPFGHHLKASLFHHSAPGTVVEDAPIRSAPVDVPASVFATTLPSDLPCNRPYFVPFYVPWMIAYNPRCIDTGYYLGIYDLSTSQGIERKVDELRQRPHEPLLLRNASLQDQTPSVVFETDMVGLVKLEGAFTVPKAKHAPMTFSPILDEIQQHYTPGPIINNGQLRIWYPLQPTPIKP